MTLAALAADEQVWIYFEREWANLLSDRGNPPYMHMKEAMPLKGAFEGWEPEARDFLVYGLLGLIMEIGQNPRFRSFTCTIDLVAHKRWKAEKNLPLPERLCARLVFPKAYEWYSSFPDPILDSIDVFFDRNERFMGHIAGDWNNKKTQKTPPIWGLVRTIAPADMRQTPPLQAADMLAWARNRMAVVERNDKFSQLARDILNGPARTFIDLNEKALSSRRFPEGGIVRPLRKPGR